MPQLLTELCSIPTAPFAEDCVVAYVEQFVKARRRLRLTRDEWGNLLIELKGRSRGPRWVFAAHMDHPGFVAKRMRDDHTVEADFRGGVLMDYVRRAKVRFFDGDREITGTVIEATSADRQRPSYPDKAVVRVRGLVTPGSPGMFDQGTGRIRGKRFYSRVCDNLAGAAAALTMLDELHRRPPRATVAVLLTRGEEDGFVGAIAAATQPRLLRKTDRLIVIECSAEQPYAKQADGCIIRVGDRTSIFNSDLSYFITAQAQALAKKDQSFKYQRALMPGGTCEATVYDVFGFAAASICVPLGNYHNMDRTKQKIGPEYVHLDDWQNMVRLFTGIARTAHTWQPGHQLLKTRLMKRFDARKRLL